MAKFRKKPVVIEAFRWMGGLIKEGDPAWIVEAFREGSVMSDGYCLAVQTPEGTMRADPGDWIIRGVKGEIDLCKPGVFEATYEPVEVENLIGHQEPVDRQPDSPQPDIPEHLHRQKPQRIIA